MPITFLHFTLSTSAHQHYTITQASFMAMARTSGLGKYTTLALSAGISAADVGWQTPSSAVISAAGNLGLRLLWQGRAIYVYMHIDILRWYDRAARVRFLSIQNKRSK